MRARARRPTGCASLFEASWAYFQMDGDSKALGNIHTINVAVLRERVLSRGVHPQGRHLLQPLQLRPLAGSDQRVQRDLSRACARRTSTASSPSTPTTRSSTTTSSRSRAARPASPSACSTPPRARSPTARCMKNIDYVDELDRELKAGRQGRPGVEVDGGRRQHPAGSDAAEVARRQRRRQPRARAPASASRRRSRSSSSRRSRSSTKR